MGTGLDNVGRAGAVRVHHTLGVVTHTDRHRPTDSAARGGRRRPGGRVWLGGWVKGDSREPDSLLAAAGEPGASIGRELVIGHSLVPWRRGLGNLPAANLADGRTPQGAPRTGRHTWRWVEPLG